MGDDEKTGQALMPFALVALFCAAASFGIVILSLKILSIVSDAGMFALALMAFAPALLGIGVAYFMSRHLSKS